VDRLTATIVDELEAGFGWIDGEKPRLRLASHALAADGRVWILDPTNAPELDDRIRSLGEPAAVVQLLDRHNRGCAEVARRFGVPHHRVPFDGIADAPFEIVRVVRWMRWNEIALWWPGLRVLVCADALGTIPHYFALGDERVGVHPLLRLTPPEVLAGFAPEHVLCGHGEGVHENAAAAVHEALTGCRRRLVRLPVELPLSLRRRDRGGRAG
jgi:hypothetical protein